VAGPYYAALRPISQVLGSPHDDTPLPPDRLRSKIVTLAPSVTRVLLIPAAGRGARLGSPLPKLLTPVAGRAMIDHVLDRYGDVINGAVIVVNPADRPLVDRHLHRHGSKVRITEQSAPTGMLDAILLAADTVRQSKPERVWITWCDQVGISPSTVATLTAIETESPDQDAILPIVRQPSPYIHFDRDAAGRLTAVRQRREGDEMPHIGTSDAGLFSLSRKAFAQWLPEYSAVAPPGSGTGERNFLPFLPWLAERTPIATFEIDVQEAQGINTPEDLAAVEQRLRLVADSSS